MKKLSLLGVILTLSAAFLWGTAGTAQSFVNGATSPYWIGAFRLIIACLFFHLLFFYRRQKETNLPTEPLSHIDVSASSRTLYWSCIAITGFCMGIYNLTFFAGIKATGIAIGTATTIGSAPIWAGILQAITTRKAPAKLWWLGTLCATIGGVWMVLLQSSTWHIDISGLFICLMAGFCYALYTLVSKRLSAIAPPLMITKHTFSLAIFIAVPVAGLMAGMPTFSLTSVIVILYLGIFTTGVAYLLYAHALKHISAPTGVALSLIEPIVAFMLAIVVAHEAVNEWAIVGLFLILVGLWLVLRSERLQKATA